MLTWADLILATDQVILTELRHLAGPADQPKIRPYLPDSDVPDPWEKSADDFTACAALIETGAGPHLP
ncbi:hypothetical protein Acy02nite_92130 [Actinoplanes cyaneus]|uniref:Phosphotyrosine protein phosphatase I domain-containing protein n=1 Tax=Actinoplanes cyaneus TaxID=52696 RepID=A0A919M9Y5_9ACTN|nr:hypothetical protein [Actinoplanes cyaneus]GID71332.1 hypothetical protein Acy02nite_92130 [Actinoplanes cyaneus]